jgi:putative PIN family toxin of toxin-antitoxin system
VKAVLDTNVLISAFVFPGGAPEHVYRRGLEGRLSLITSRPLLSELGRVLTEKFGWESPYAEEVVSQLLRIAVVVDPTEQITDITDDPADNRVLEAAAEGDAEVIVSGDRHLLTLGTWRGIRILTPAAVMDELP